MRSARALGFAACTALFGTLILTSSQGVESTTAPYVSEPRPDAAPAPIMIGTPIFYDGPMAGRYPNASWLREINSALANRGFQHVESCLQRVRSDSFAYLVGCDGRFKFVSDMYRAAASMSPPIEVAAEPEPQVVKARAPGEKIPDIVDSTVPLRIKTYGAAHEMAAAASRHDVPIYGRPASEPFVDPALSAAVPRVANRSAVPQLLHPSGPVTDPLPSVASASAPAPRPSVSGTPTPAARPKIVTVETPEKVDRPRLADFTPGAAAAPPSEKVDQPPAPAASKAAKPVKAEKRASAKSRQAGKIEPEKTKMASSPDA